MGGLVGRSVYDEEGEQANRNWQAFLHSREVDTIIRINITTPNAKWDTQRI